MQPYVLLYNYYDNSLRGWLLQEESYTYIQTIKVLIILKPHLMRRV